MMPLVAKGKTDVGKKREFNEDAFAVDLSTGLLALADGMGGHAAGEVAARIAIDAVSDYIARSGAARVDQWPYGFDDRLSIPANRLLSAFRLANEKIFKAIEEREELRGMGTTLVTALAQNTDVCFAHVGDSRIYRYRKGGLVQLTRDHSWPSEDGAMRNVLTRAIGAEDNVEIDHRLLDVAPGDIFLLCSDGLTRPVTDETIVHTLRESTNGEQASARLIDLAKEKGAPDNVTVVLVYC